MGRRQVIPRRKAQFDIDRGPAMTNITTLPDLSGLPPLHPEQMLTTEQLAALTGISKATFEGWRCRKNGGPKATPLSKQIVRYRWADVCAWRDKTPTSAR
jgi:predicted DNA-binding transcriptional regulator AlpA